MSSSKEVGLRGLRDRRSAPLPAEYQEIVQRTVDQVAQEFREILAKADKADKAKDNA